MGNIVSMTGIGIGVAEGDGLRVRLVLRSVNGRFFDLQVRCPQGMQEFEQVVRDRLQGHIHRGKMSANLELVELEDADGYMPTLNEAMARRYLEELKRLAQIGGMEAQPSLDVVTRLPGLFRSEGGTREQEQVSALVSRALEDAIAEFDGMREAEGRSLADDLQGRINRVEEMVQRVEEIASQTKERARDKLREKVEALLRPGEVDENRLATEIVLIAERSDVTEEIVRFHSHNSQFLEALQRGGDVGKRLNFLLQEMHREANTISSKSIDSDIIHTVVDVKEEVERLREQVQNLA